MKHTLLKLVGLGIVGFTLVGCESPVYVKPVKEPIRQENLTFQQIENARYLKVGMTEAEVTKVMGDAPIVREFQGKHSALQWCTTGLGGTSTPYDRYVVAYFTHEQLTEVKNYSNKDNIQHGDCSTLYREVQWLEPANNIIEYRDRNMNQYR